jgi:hypothetical protein
MFPLDFGGISLLIAIIAIILLVSSVMLSSYSGKTNILINKKRLKTASIAFSMTFIITAAAFVMQTPREPLFEDGFESGSFSAWTDTSATTGTATVVSTITHSGTYSSRFNANASTGVRRAYSYENTTGLSDLHASAYMKIAEGLPLSNGQSAWLVQFEGPIGTVRASFGVRADTAGTRWAVQYVNRSYDFATKGPNMGAWYLIDAYYTHAASGKTIVLYVNGEDVVSLSENTIGDSDVVRVRFGLGYFAGTSAATVYMDDVKIGT